MCASLQKAVRTEARDGREAESGVLHVADVEAHAVAEEGAATACSGSGASGEGGVAKVDPKHRPNLPRV